MRNYPLNPFTVAEVAKKLTDERVVWWAHNAKSPMIRAAAFAELEVRSRTARPGCDCGSPNARWYGDPCGLREYCCEACAVEMVKSGRLGWL